MIFSPLTEALLEVILVKYVTPFILLVAFVFQPKAHAQFSLSTLTTIGSYALDGFNYLKDSASNLIPEPIIYDYPTTCDLITADDPLRFGPFQPGYIAELGVENYSLLLKHEVRGDYFAELGKNQKSVSCRSAVPGTINTLFQNLGNNFMPCSQTVGTCKHPDHMVNMSSLCNCVIDKTGSDSAKQYVPFKDQRELDTMIDAVRAEFTQIALDDTLADIDRVSAVSTNLVLSEDFNPLLVIKKDSSDNVVPVKAHLCMGGALVHQVRELFEGSGETGARCRPESAEVMLEAYIKLHQCGNVGEDCIDYKSILNDPRMKSKPAHEKLGMLLTVQHSKLVNPMYGLKEGERPPVGNDMVFRIFEMSSSTVDPKTLAYKENVGMYSDPYPNINARHSFDFITKLIKRAATGEVMTTTSLDDFSSEEKSNFIYYLRRNPVYAPFFKESQTDEHAILSFTSRLIHHHNNNPERKEESLDDNDYIGKIWGFLATELLMESQKNCDQSRRKLGNLCEALSDDGMALFSNPDFAPIFTKLSSFESGEKFAALNGDDNLAAFFRTEQVLCHANRRSLQARCDRERLNSAEQGPPRPPEHCDYDASWLFEKTPKQEVIAERYNGVSRTIPKSDADPAARPTSAAARNRPSTLATILPPNTYSHSYESISKRVSQAANDIKPQYRATHPLASLARSPSRTIEKNYPQENTLSQVKPQSNIIGSEENHSNEFADATNRPTAFFGDFSETSFREANSLISPSGGTIISGSMDQTAVSINPTSDDQPDDALQTRLDKLLEERLKKIEAQERLTSELEQSETELEQERKELELAELKAELAELNSDITKQKKALATRQATSSNEKDESMTRRPASLARAEVANGGINNGLASRVNLAPTPVSSTGGNSNGNSNPVSAGSANAGRRLSSSGAGPVSGAVVAGRHATDGAGLVLRQTSGAITTTLPVGTPIAQMVTRLNEQGFVLRETGVPGQTEKIIFALDESGQVLYVNNEPVFTIEIINAGSEVEEGIAEKPLDEFQEYLEMRRQYRWESVLDAIDTAKKD